VTHDGAAEQTEQHHTHSITPASLLSHSDDTKAFLRKAHSDLLKV
jgi:hypothetical protein